MFSCFCFFFCSESQGKHSSPVWQVRWVDRDQGSGEERDEILISISADGRVTKWSIRKGFECTGEECLSMKNLRSWYCSHARSQCLSDRALTLVFSAPSSKISFARSISPAAQSIL